MSTVLRHKPASKSTSKWKLPKLLKFLKPKPSYKDARIFDDIILKDTLNNQITLSDKWKNQTILLKVLPRLGCCLCRHEVKMLKKLSPILEEHNIKLIAVAFEDIDLKDFLNGYWEWDILLDPERRVYKAAGLTRLNDKQFSDQMESSFVKKIDNFVMDILGIKDSGKGDAKQLGATFIINDSSDFLYKFVPNKLATFPCIKEMCEIIGGDPTDIEDDIPAEAIVRSKSSKSQSSFSSSKGSESS